MCVVFTACCISYRTIFTDIYCEYTAACSRTLDVIVEGAVSIPVFVEDAKGVAVGEILKLNQAAHPVPAERRSDGVGPRESLTYSFSFFVSTHLSVTACMNSSISSSYSFPRILLCFSPMYKGSSSSA